MDRLSVADIRSFRLPLSTSFVLSVKGESVGVLAKSMGLIFADADFDFLPAIIFLTVFGFFTAASLCKRPAVHSQAAAHAIVPSNYIVDCLWDQRPEGGEDAMSVFAQIQVDTDSTLIANCWPGRGKKCYDFN
jgi:hypothetical protein